MSHWCLFCSRPEAPQCCGRCHKARYCDERCQRLDWPGAHKLECGKPVAPLPEKPPGGFKPRQLNKRMDHTGQSMGELLGQEAAGWSPIVDNEAGAKSEALKLVYKALRIVPFTGSVLAPLAHSVDDGAVDATGWLASASLVKAQGGMLVFGWSFYEHERAIKGVPHAAWCDADNGRMYSVTTGQPASCTLFVPDANVRGAFRVAGEAPPLCVWWK